MIVRRRKVRYAGRGLEGINFLQRQTFLRLKHRKVTRKAEWVVLLAWCSTIRSGFWLHKMKLSVHISLLLKVVPSKWVGWLHVFPNFILDHLQDVSSKQRLNYNTVTIWNIELSRLLWRLWFEAYISLQGYRLLIGHRGEVKGMSVAFRGFLWGKVICLDHSCFNSYFDLFVLDSTLLIYHCPGQERGAPSSAVCVKRDLRRRRGMYGR